MKNPSNLNLNAVLKDWTEIDAAAFHIGVDLGIIPPLTDEKEIYNFGGKKWVFWTENPLGTALFNILEILVSADILEKHDEDDHLYRWNADFDWENLG